MISKISCLIWTYLRMIIITVHLFTVLDSLRRMFFNILLSALKLIKIYIFLLSQLDIFSSHLYMTFFFPFTVVVTFTCKK